VADILALVDRHIKGVVNMWWTIAITWAAFLAGFLAGAVLGAASRRDDLEREIRRLRRRRHMDIQV